MASSVVVNKPPSRRTPAAGRAGRAMAALGAVRRTTLLLVLAAVVLSLGMVAGNGSGEDRPASFSEIAQTDAQAGAVELARQAGDLAGSGSTGPLNVELARQAKVLEEQSVLLVRAGSFRRGVPPFTLDSSGAEPAMGASGTDAPESESTAAAARYVRSLAASARASLDAAMRADAGTARVLAATGAAQQVLALRAAAVAGLAAPADWQPVEPAAADTRCTADGTASPAASGNAASGDTGSGSESSAGALPDAAAALQGAVDAEYGAAYAYEVAMARTSGAAAREALGDIRDEHLAAGADGVQLLPAVCLPALTRVPAYSLPSSFEEDPAKALHELEASLPAVYADAAALGSGSVRAWAVERLVELATGLYGHTRSVPAAPGVGTESAGLPPAARTP